MVREVLVGATAFLYLAVTGVTATPAPQAEAAQADAVQSAPSDQEAPSATREPGV